MIVEQANKTYLTLSFVWMSLTLDGPGVHGEEDKEKDHRKDLTTDDEQHLIQQL